MSQYRRIRTCALNITCDNSDVNITYTHTQIVARCDFDRELVSMDGDYEGDPAS